MLSIRLARAGRKNLAQFRVVVQQKTKSPKSGAVVAELGSYDPTDKANAIKVDAAVAEKFMKNGAEVSDTVARLFKRAGVKVPEKFIKKYTKQVNEEKLKEMQAAEEAKRKAAEEARKAAEAAAAEAEAAAKAAAEAAEAEKAAAEAAEAAKKAEEAAQNAA